MKSQTFFRLLSAWQKEKTMELIALFFKGKVCKMWPYILCPVSVFLYSLTASFLELVFIFLSSHEISLSSPAKLGFYQKKIRVSVSVSKLFCRILWFSATGLKDLSVLGSYLLGSSLISKYKNSQMPRCHKCLLVKYRHPPSLAIIICGLNVFWAP